jgi:antitoxin HicB
MNNLFLYPFEIKPLTEEKGGGYLISFPDFNECISDGETPEEAMKNGFDALQETIDALESMGFPIPKPFSSRQKNDIFVQQIPENLYQRLETLAKKEKININTLINSLLEESLTKKETKIAS